MSFIATGITAGLTAMGVGATAAGIAGTVGAGALIGSGLGAATSALTGGDPGKGALFGALGGVATGGLGSLMGAGAGAGGAAAEAVGGIEGTGGSFIEQAAREGIGAIPEASPAVGSTAQSLAATAAPTLNAVAAPATSALAGGFTGFGNLGDMAAKEIGGNVVQQGFGGVNQAISNAQTQKDSDKIHQQFFSGPTYAHGGDVQHAARQGGSIKLQDGAFIIPADVVSALGNGSSKAGAKYLTHLFKALEAGPPPRAGTLAKQRAQARHTA